MADGQTLRDWLVLNGAHHDVVEWSQPYGHAWEKALQECPRGDWLLGIASKLNAPRRAIVQAACACARTAFDLVADPPEAAIASVEAWLANGDGDRPPEFRQLADSVEQRRADNPTDDAVNASVLAAIESIAAPEHAAGAAANAAQAAVFAVGDCAMMPALAHAHRTTADVVRQTIAFADLIGAAQDEPQ